MILQVRPAHVVNQEILAVVTVVQFRFPCAASQRSLSFPSRPSMRRRPVDALRIVTQPKAEFFGAASAFTAGGIPRVPRVAMRTVPTKSDGGHPRVQDCPRLWMLARSSAGRPTMPALLVVVGVQGIAITTCEKKGGSSRSYFVPIDL